MQRIASWVVAATVAGALGACSASSSSSAPGAGDASDGGASNEAAPTGDDGPEDANAAQDGPAASDANDAASQDAGPTYPAPHPAAPQIVTGGTIDAQPKIVTVSFAGDPLEADIDAFATAIGKTTYWGDRTREYGIAALAPAGRIHDPTTWPASLDDAQIQTWLISQLDGADAGWPAPDKDTIYALYFPPGVSITNQAQGQGASCGTPTMPSWHGYHENVMLPGGLLVPYAVISRCDSIPEAPGATGIQYVSAVTSHEVIEAITDPFVIAGQLGYFGTDPDHVAFELVTGAELGDMCTLIGNAFYTPTDFPYLVQRIWSNSAAAMGHDPCPPEPSGQIYFNSAPVLTDTISVPSPFGTGVVTTKGVMIPVGQSKTVEVDLFSEAPAAAWNVRAVETDGTTSLAFAFDKTSGQNGDKLNLTIRVVHAKAGGGAESFALVSTRGSQLSFWAGFVTNN
jgi:hypothetical protein